MPITSTYFHNLLLHVVELNKFFLINFFLLILSFMLYLKLH